MYVAALLAIVAAGLFALQADDRENNGFQISRGPAFYIQVSTIIYFDFCRPPINNNISIQSHHIPDSPDRSDVNSVRDVNIRYAVRSKGRRRPNQSHRPNGRGGHLRQSGIQRAYRTRYV